MKTPEEIKKGLEACGADECHGNHTGCPYKGYLFCFRNVCGDALAYIQQLENEKLKNFRSIEKMTKYIKELEATNDVTHKLVCEGVIERNELKALLAQVERERDAAISELKNSCVACRFVGKEFDDSPCECCFQRGGKYPWSPIVRTKFEWRGVCPENTKEET